MTLIISREDGSLDRATVTLEGRFEGPWPARVQRECLALLDYFSDVAINFSMVSAMDPAGLQTLERLHRAGVTMHGLSGAIATSFERDRTTVEPLAIRTA